ncbi:MAG: hypothetical protein ABI612_10985 [Betaproteobacteria bacterium]
MCERRGLFYSDSGVCAAPDAMIEAFLSLWIDGKGAEADSEILGQQLLLQTVTDPETAFRYGMHGARLVNISMAFRARMAEFMESALETLSSDPTESEDIDRVRVALATACDEHVTHSLAPPTTRARSAILAGDAFARAAEALGSNRVDLDSLLTTSVPPSAEALIVLATQLMEHASGFSRLTAECLRTFSNTLASYLQCEAATTSAL